MENKSLLSGITYHPPLHNRQTVHKKSITVIGLDSEADRQGRTFLWCSSRGDAWEDSEVPRCWFTREYRGCNFVVYNLKYEQSAILKRLPAENLTELRKTDTTIYAGFTYKTIGYKCLTIRRGSHSVHIYDISPFFLSSLDNAAKTYLDACKDEMDPELFYKWFIAKYVNVITEYCINDAVLTAKLAELIISNFETFGVKPQKLYSTAYISWQYFRTHCKYIHVKKYWDYYPHVLEYSLRAYNGGKFEVTTKGLGKYYEYDIVSAYPYEIAGLIDIVDAAVEKFAGYRKDSAYSMLDCIVNIPMHIPNPSPIKNGMLNTYPAGIIRRVLHKCEYEYFVESGCDIEVLSGVHLFAHRGRHPYKAEINKMMRYKSEYKKSGDLVRYKLVKITMNSLYGKFVQLTKTPESIRAGAAWNPIYAGHITAACRVRMARMQRDHKSIVAVHTDSVISTAKLPYSESNKLGDMSYEIEGEGVILGSGIYQIGTKTRFRGFPVKTPLLDLIPESGNKLKYSKKRPFGWREISFRNMTNEWINYFVELEKGLNLNFDRKRIWIEDWQDFSEVRKRNVNSIPIVHGL